MILPPRGEIKKRSQIEGREKGAGADRGASKGIQEKARGARKKGQIEEQAKGYGEDSRIEKKKGGEERKRSEKKGRKEPVFLGAFLFRGKDLKAVKPTNEQWAGPLAPPIARLDRLEGGYLVILAASSTNFFNPFSVKGCTSIPLMADRGAVTTSAPNRAHPVMCFTWRMEAARMRVSMA